MRVVVNEISTLDVEINIKSIWIKFLYYRRSVKDFKQGCNGPVYFPRRIFEAV